MRLPEALIAFGGVAERRRKFGPLAAASAASLLNSFIIAILYARLAGAAPFGQYQLALAGAGGAGVLTLSGAASAATRAAAQGRRAAWPLFRLRLPYCFAAAALLEVAALLFWRYGDAQLAAALAAAGATLPLFLGADTFPAQLLGEGRFGSYCTFQVVVQGLAVLGVAAAVLLAADQPWLAVLATTGITGGVQLVGLLGVRSRAAMNQEDVSYARTLTGIAVLSAVAARADVLATGAILGTREAGLVGAARAFPGLVRRLWDMIHPVLFVQLAALGTRASFRRATSYRLPLVAALSVPSAAGIALAPWAVPLMFGRDFAEAVTVTQLLLLAAAIAPFGFPEAFFLRVRGDRRRLGIASILLPMITLAALPVLVWAIGLEGVGAAAVLGSILYVAVHVPLARQHAREATE